MCPSSEVIANIQGGSDPQPRVSRIDQNSYYILCSVLLMPFSKLLQGPDRRRKVQPPDELEEGGPTQPSRPLLMDGFPVNMRVNSIRQRVLQVDDGEGENVEVRSNYLYTPPQNNQVVRNHASGFGQMLNPYNSCFASASIQCLTTLELDLHLDPNVERSANFLNLDQVYKCPLCCIYLPDDRCRVTLRVLLCQQNICG